MTSGATFSTLWLAIVLAGCSSTVGTRRPLAPLGVPEVDGARQEATPQDSRADAVVLEGGEVVRGRVVSNEPGAELVLVDGACAERRIPRALIRKV